MTNRDRYDAIGPITPAGAHTWAVALTDDVDGLVGGGLYATFDAQGDVDAARPTEPAGANFIWFDVPDEPTNLGTYDIWTSDAELSTVGTFTDLTDTPAGYGDAAGFAVAVNSAGDGVEFVPFPSGASSTGGGTTVIDGGDASSTGISVFDGGTA